MAGARLPGLAAVVVPGSGLGFTGAYGFADREAGRPMTPETPVAMGSTGKGMTALAVLQLAEQGLVDLDAPVVRYLPDFTMADPRAPEITLRQLLSMSAGLPASNAFEGAQDAGALERRVAALATVRLSRAPGAGFEYANDGFNVAGLVVQRVSGLLFERYMAERVFAPLGMRRTTYDPARGAALGLAQGYGHHRGAPVPLPTPLTRGYNPAGMVLASAADVGRYLLALLNGGALGAARVLAPASVGGAVDPRRADRRRGGRRPGLGRGRPGRAAGGDLEAAAWSPRAPSSSCSPTGAWAWPSWPTSTTRGPSASWPGPRDPRARRRRRPGSRRRRGGPWPGRRARPGSPTAARGTATSGPTPAPPAPSAVARAGDRLLGTVDYAGTSGCWPSSSARPRGGRSSSCPRGPTPSCCWATPRCWTSLPPRSSRARTAGRRWSRRGAVRRPAIGGRPPPAPRPAQGAGGQGDPGPHRRRRRRGRRPGGRPGPAPPELGQGGAARGRRAAAPTGGSGVCGDAKPRRLKLAAGRLPALPPHARARIPLPREPTGGHRLTAPRDSSPPAGDPAPSSQGGSRIARFR